MYQSSKFHGNYTLFANAIINLLTGLTVAFLSTLLIYFKQKEILHHTVVLFSVLSVYFLSYIFRDRIEKISRIAKVASLIFLFVVCLLAPQFLYQIRPYTFYISGFAIGGILIVATANVILVSSKGIKNPWNFSVFLFGYIVAYLLPQTFVQHIIVGLLIAVVFIFFVSDQFKIFIKFSILGILALPAMIFWWYSVPLVYHDEQSDYEDKVLFTAETQYHNLVVTQWHEDHWFFLDKLKNISSIDEYLYYEPMTHGLFKTLDSKENALVIGGENGCLIREVLKYDAVKHIDVISYDTLLRQLGMKNSYFTTMNKNAYKHKKVHIIHEELLQHISKSNRKYEAIFIDLPDPRSIETNQFYTIEFYDLVQNLLNENGVMITQAGSPYYATEAFYTIGRTISEAGFHVLPIHNQILTLGEWGWYICSADLEADDLKYRLLEQKELAIETKWFNLEAANLISAFGKTYNDTLHVHINSLDNPLVYKYYLKGNWDLK